MRARFLTSLALAALVVAAPAFAEKLKGFYSGSGGIDAAVHRVVMVQFAEDGTVLVQQNWDSGKSDIWHAHWTQQGDKVTITFDLPKNDPPKSGSQTAAPQKNSPPPSAPLVMNIKHGSLVAETWDAVALGVLGPPTLSPFGAKNVLKHSVASCVSINNTDPTNDCVQWDSRSPK